MDFQNLINSINELEAMTRSQYHLTYGELIKALKAAPANAVFDKRIKGVGSWRGSYIEIALYTKYNGYYAEKEEFNNYGDNFHENYKRWQEDNVVEAKELPRNANELGKVLESLLGMEFVGYKGGNFKIEEYKPLWLEDDDSTCYENAIVGIDDKLKLIIKERDKQNERSS